MRWFYAFVLLLGVLLGCDAPDPILDNVNETSVKLPVVMLAVELDAISIEQFVLDTNQHYRGLDFNLETSTVVVAGSKGHVAFGKYNKQEISWDGSFNVDSLHLRDVEIWEDRVIVMSIASPGYIKELRTDFLDVDTSAVWQTRFYNNHEKVFLDGVDFWENGSGLAFGDPFGGRHHVIKTTNSGVAWGQIPRTDYPDTIPFEAGFAASGTGVVCVGEGVGYIAYGGVKARIFKTEDYGDSWLTIETPIAHGKAGKGIYCMAWKNELEGVIAGGNWEEPEGDSCYAFTSDGGVTWNLGSGGSGYRSGICHVFGDTYFSVGTKGTDISVDGGVTWKQIAPDNLNAIKADSLNRIAIGVGSYGKAVKVTF
jgi:hypothetical protein